MTGGQIFTELKEARAAIQSVSSRSEVLDRTVNGIETLLPVSLGELFVDESGHLVSRKRIGQVEEGLSADRPSFDRSLAEECPDVR